VIHPFEMLKGAEALIIPLAIATLTSGFSDGVVLLTKLKTRYIQRRERRAKLGELEKLQKSLVPRTSKIDGSMHV